MGRGEERGGKNINHISILGQNIYPAATAFPAQGSAFLRGSQTLPCCHPRTSLEEKARAHPGALLLRWGGLARLLPVSVGLPGTSLPLLLSTLTQTSEVKFPEAVAGSLAPNSRFLALSQQTAPGLE